MAFTASDLTTIEAAIIAIASGTRVVECEIDGDRVEYHKADLKNMLALRDQIRAEIAAAATTASTYGRTRIAVTTKGY